METVANLPCDVWRRIAWFLPFDDTLTLLRVLRVCRASFAWLEDKCWQLLYFLAQRLRTSQHRGDFIGGIYMHRAGAVHYLPRLVCRIAQRPGWYTRENMSYMLALLVHGPPTSHTVDRWRYVEMLGHDSLDLVYCFNKRDHTVHPLCEDPRVQVYDAPLGPLRRLNEAEAYALTATRSHDDPRQYALAYAMARDHLPLRAPRPDDPLSRVVFDGEHIFSEARTDACAELFRHPPGSPSADTMRARDIIALNVTTMRPTRLVFPGREESSESMRASDDTPLSFSGSGSSSSSSDDGTTLDSDMFSDAITEITEETTSCELGSHSTPDQQSSDCSETLGESDECGSNAEDDDEEDADFAQYSDAGDSSSSDDTVIAAPLLRVLDCT